MGRAGPDEWPIFEQASDSMVVYEPETGAVVAANPRFSDLSAYSRAELRELAMADLTAEGSAAPTSAELVRAAEDTTTTGWSLAPKTGPTVPVTLAVTTVSVDGNRRLLGTVRELTPRVADDGDVAADHRRTEQFAVLQRVLRHDLRNNLNTILMNARPLEEALEDDRLQRRARFIRESADETVELSEKIEQAERALATGGSARSSVDITAVLREEASKLRSQHPEADITVDAAETQEILANDLVDRAVRNLLQNAIEHNDRDEPTIEVTMTRGQAGEVAVHIADDGPGIPEEQVAALADCDPDLLGEFEGLGLWLVNWIVTSSGGDLRFERNDPRGTVVTVTLPGSGPQSES